MLLFRRRYGTSIILVTHNIGVVSAMADTVLVLREGEAVEYGEAEKVTAGTEGSLYPGTASGRRPGFGGDRWNLYLK